MVCGKPFRLAAVAVSASTAERRKPNRALGKPDGDFMRRNPSFLDGNIPHYRERRTKTPVINSDGLGGNSAPVLFRVGRKKFLIVRLQFLTDC
jgi:hypothetical protein